MVNFVVKTSDSLRLVSYRDGIPFAETAQGLAKVSQTFSRLSHNLRFASNFTHLPKFWKK